MEIPFDYILISIMINLKNQKGESAISIALNTGQNDIVKILKKIYGAKLIINTKLIGEQPKNESDEFINKVIDFFDAEIIEKK